MNDDVVAARRPVRGGPFRRRSMLGASAALGALALASAVAPPPARAAGPPAPVAPMILDLMSRPVDSYDAAFNQMIREAGPAPRRPTSEGKVLPDGSVQYGEGKGSVIVTVREGSCGAGSGSGVGVGRYEPRRPIGLRAR